MKRILISCALLSSCATAMLLAEIKVGYISSSEIITKSKIGKEIKGKMAQEKEEEFKRLQAKLNDRLTKEILETAADMGKAEGYDELKDIDSGRTLYVNPNYVVTSKYIGRMDKKYDVEHAPKAAPAKKA
jgi:Skp family chaperone for outer membrane proteins